MKHEIKSTIKQSMKTSINGGAAITVTPTTLVLRTAQEKGSSPTTLFLRTVGAKSNG